MAKKNVNKSEEIRKLLSEKPKAKVRDIVTALAERGIKVPPSTVYVLKKKVKRRQRLERATHTANNAKIANPAELVVKVKSLAKEAGGYGNLRQLVDALAS